MTQIEVLGSSLPSTPTDNLITPSVPNDVFDSTASADIRGSQQTSWWDVHEFVTPLLEAVGQYPAAGTPAWCALSADDVRKVAAVFDAAQHWALRVDACQEAMAAACHAVSAGGEASLDKSSAADWKRIAQEESQRTDAIARGAYIPRLTS